MILGQLPVLVLLITVWLLVERYRARRFNATKHRRLLEKHGDPSDIPYYYSCHPLQESRTQSDETLLVTGRLPMQQKTADVPSFGPHCNSYSCSSTSHETCSMFSECGQSSDTRLEDTLVIGLQVPVEREMIPPGEQAIGMTPATCCCSGHSSIKKFDFRPFVHPTGYYQYDNNN